MSVFNSKRFFFYDSKNREKAKNISFPLKKFLFNVPKKREKAKNISFPQYFFLPDPKEMEQKEMTKSHFLLSPGREYRNLKTTQRYRTQNDKKKLSNLQAQQIN